MSGCIWVLQWQFELLVINNIPLTVRLIQTLLGKQSSFSVRWEQLLGSLRSFGRTKVAFSSRKKKKIVDFVSETVYCGGLRKVIYCRIFHLVEVIGQRIHMRPLLERYF